MPRGRADETPGSKRRRGDGGDAAAEPEPVLCDHYVAELVEDKQLDMFFAPAGAGQAEGERVCLRQTCRHKLLDHKYKRRPVTAPTGAAAAAAPAAAPAAGEARRGPLQKSLEKATDAYKVTRQFSSAYRHDFARADPPVDVDRLLQHADTLNEGYAGCEELPQVELPRQMTRAAAMQSWDRGERLADVVDVIKGRLDGEVHRNTTQARVYRKDLFVGGEAYLTYDEAVELSRGLGCLSLGLRVVSRRDRRMFEREHKTSPYKQQAPQVGDICWFVAVRTRALTKLVAWMRSALRTGRYAGLGDEAGETGEAAAAASGGGGGGGSAGGGRGAAAGAAASSSTFNIVRFARMFPWVGIGAAVIARGGRDDPDAASDAWAALSAADVVAREGAKELHTAKPKQESGGDGGGGAASGAAGGGGAGGGNGGGAGTGAAATPRWKARRQQKAAARQSAKAAAATDGGDGGSGGGGGGGGGAGGGGGGGGGAGDAVAAARAVIAAKAVDSITQRDCRAADLCFTCKRPYHGKGCSERRGQAF